MHLDRPDATRTRPSPPHASTKRQLDHWRSSPITQERKGLSHVELFALGGQRGESFSTKRRGELGGRIGEKPLLTDELRCRRRPHRGPDDRGAS